MATFTFEDFKKENPINVPAKQGIMAHGNNENGHLSGEYFLGIKVSYGSTLLLALVIMILAAGMFFSALGMHYLLSQKGSDIASTPNYYGSAGNSSNNTSSSANGAIIAANMIFIDKVLETQGDISVQEKSYVEQAMANTGDGDIVNGWHQFLESTTESQAQENTRLLLKIFLSKIR